MGLSDKKQTSTQTQSGQSATSVPDTPDIIRARTDRAQIDPSIGYRLGESQRNLKDSFSNPLGGYTTPQILDAIMRSEGRELAQQAGQQTREGQFDVNRLNQSRNLALAGLTRGSQSTSSGQSKGTVTQSESPFGTIAAIAGQAAPLSL